MKRINGTRVDLDASDYSIVTLCRVCGHAEGHGDEERAITAARVHWGLIHPELTLVETGPVECAYGECIRPAHRRGICATHYMRERRAAQKAVAS